MADPVYAQRAAGFFKTGKGQYGEGDIFLGIRACGIKDAAKQFRELPIESIGELTLSPVHEERSTALLILVLQYQKGSAAMKKKIFDWYMSNTGGINNWDLVDLSAPNIPGDWLLDKDRSILLKFARSRDLWKRRIAIVSTLTFIRSNDLATTFTIADILMHDDQDLIHKAVGWMLREAGKKDLRAEESFLTTRCKTMPRTMLRYAIERFPETKRKKYLQGTI
jgi:3-methyladenine DNA glycosylase AlkD